MKNKNSKNFSERREHPRFKIKYPTILYLKNKTMSVLTVDISEGGIGIILTHQIPPGEIFKLKIRCALENNDNKDMNIKAKVIWCKYIGEGEYSAGLKIMKYLDEKKHLERIVK